jgi:hypothetical protein
MRSHERLNTQWSPLPDHADEVDWDWIGIAKADLTLLRWLSVAVLAAKQRLRR